MIIPCVFQKINNAITESAKCFTQLLNFEDVIRDYENEVEQDIKELRSKVKNSSLIKCLLNLVRLLIFLFWALTTSSKRTRSSARLL